ncbi:MAG: hypothetical protein QF632_00615 [Candidatus Woesearchaeota archaeon]|jgi:4-hydroxybenzoate polyprenyltransferase|nr:hypothetical protein [Candidatus Woesearchaeota archaeon]|tara:strand:- start:63 stop:401 length:339 start_codon:yes stop_codon:yes gene_type:complete
MAKFNFLLEWPEAIAFLVLVIGFIVSLTSTSAVVSYIIIFLSGMLFGKLWYRTKKSGHFKFFLIIFGFLVGFLIGSSLVQYGNRGVMVFLFGFGWLTTYYLHSKGLLFSKDF